MPGGLAPFIRVPLEERIGVDAARGLRLQDRYHGWMNPYDSTTQRNYDAKAGFPFDYNGVHYADFMNDLIEAQPGNYMITRTAPDYSRSQYRLTGRLMDNDRQIGGITRTFANNPNGRTVSFDYFGVTPRSQGKGIAKRLMAAQFGKYREMGIDRVNVRAALDRGGYAWARLGALPEQDDWDLLRKRLKRNTNDPEVRNILNRADPKAIWDLADHPEGKRLLSGTSWSGFYDLHDPETWDRIKSYTGADW